MKEPPHSVPNTLNWPVLQGLLAHQPEITRSQLMDFYRSQTPEVPQTTLDWRIHELVRRGLLTTVGRGRYALPNPLRHQHSYHPVPDAEASAVWQLLLQELQLPEGCLWSTAWVNEFSLHQAFRNFLVVEAPRDYGQAVFYALQDQYSHRVFLNPRPEVLTYYVAETSQPLVVLPFVSRAPVQQVDQVPVPRLEKLLVDLFSRPDLFPAFQGQELKTIFTNANRRYLLDERTLLRYAQRRHKADALRGFLHQLPDWSSPTLDV